LAARWLDANAEAGQNWIPEEAFARLLLATVAVDLRSSSREEALGGSPAEFQGGGCVGRRRVTGGNGAVASGTKLVDRLN
jgi:hypothetical protein